MGLRGEFVHDTYIEVNGQWHKKYGFAKTKNGKERNTPITRMIREELEGLIKRNGTGYLFSENGGEEPMPQGTITYQFKKALEKIGINESERRTRKITFHGWRHFLNTTLRMANVTDSKIREVTGHSSEQMTDYYTHFDPREFTEVGRFGLRQIASKFWALPKTPRKIGNRQIVRRAGELTPCEAGF